MISQKALASGRARLRLECATMAAKLILLDDFHVAQRRARQLGIKLKDLESSTMTGAYLYRPLNLIEFCLHEAAHLVTLGYSPQTFPGLRRWRDMPLTDVVTEHFDLISPEASDRLEIDAARVTFLSGQILELWDDEPGPIMDSTRKNLSISTRWGVPTARIVEEAFACLQADRWPGQAICHKQASLVAAWFRGKERKSL